MKKLLVLLLMLLTQILVPTHIKGQEKERVFEVPLTYVSYLLLNDPKCPIQLSDPRVIAFRDDNYKYYFTATNSSNKPVKNYKIKSFDAFVDPLESFDGTDSIGDTKVLPGKSILSFPDEDYENRYGFEVARPDTKRIAVFESSGFRRKTRVVMVTSVGFFDGVDYNATAKYKSLENFVEQMEKEEAMPQSSQLTMKEKETRIRDFMIQQFQEEK